jgi:hypothetical protein
MKVLTKDKYDEEVIELGEKLKAEKIIPDLSKDRYFEGNYKQKIEMHLASLLDAHNSTCECIAHNMFGLEILVDMGYIVWGKGFEAKFNTEYENAKAMFQMLRQYFPQQSKIYETLREKSELAEKVDVLKRHKLIRTEKETARVLDDGVFKVVHDVGKHYSKSMKEQVCLIAALINRIDAVSYAQKVRTRD